MDVSLNTICPLSLANAKPNVCLSNCALRDGKNCLLRIFLETKIKESKNDVQRP